MRGYVAMLAAVWLAASSAAYAAEGVGLAGLVEGERSGRPRRLNEVAFPPGAPPGEQSVKRIFPRRKSSC